MEDKKSFNGSNAKQINSNYNGALQILLRIYHTTPELLTDSLWLLHPTSLLTLDNACISQTAGNRSPGFHGNHSPGAIPFIVKKYIQEALTVFLASLADEWSRHTAPPLACFIAEYLVSDVCANWWTIRTRVTEYSARISCVGLALALYYTVHYK